MHVRDERQFRCFMVRPRSRRGDKPIRGVSLASSRAYLEGKYRTPTKRPSAADSVAERRIARGEDPETGLPVGGVAVAGKRRAGPPEWTEIAGMALSLFGGRGRGWRRRLT